MGPTIILGSRTSPSTRHPGQQGSILLFVMVMVLVLSIAAVAILSASLNSDVVAVKLEDSTKHSHKVDGALEDVVNEVRNDGASCVSPMPPVTVEGGDSFDVDCVNTAGSEPGTRRADILVSEGSNVAGKARVLVIDDPTEGFSIEVCDWLLGRQVTESLKGCA